MLVAHSHLIGEIKFLLTTLHSVGEVAEEANSQLIGAWKRRREGIAGDWKEKEKKRKKKAKPG